MMKATIKRILRFIVIKLISYSFIRRSGQRVLKPFPRLKGWVIRLVQAGRFGGTAAEPNRTEGMGTRQQRLLNGLQQRRKLEVHE
ncbi:hypothetical protein [Vreelandella sp. EE27]